MYGNRILDRIAKDHQADERRLAAEARRAAVGRPAPADRPGERTVRRPHPSLLRRLLGLSGT